MDNVRVFSVVAYIQLADDGDTTHYGGVFHVREFQDAKCEKLDTEVSRYFRGNDRQCSPADCVIDVLEEFFGIFVLGDEQHDALEEVLGDVIDDNEREYRFFFREDGTFTCDPL